MTIIDNYKELPKLLKGQLDKIEKKFIDNREVQECYSKYLKDFRDSHQINDYAKSIIFKMSILKTISPRYFFDQQWFKQVYCYGEDGSKIKLNKIMKVGKHAVVCEGKFKETPVIIKWYQSVKRNITFETNIYQQLHDRGCITPDFSSKYQFWGTPVLILEKLLQLDSTDNEYQLGIQIIKQLRYLHKLGVHCDIKPQNIMKKVVNNKVKYLLIDFGGVATEPLSYGYRRWLWSPKWTSQPPHRKNQIVSFKHDFIELGYTLKAVQNWRKNKTEEDGEFKSGYKSKLKRYMNRVDQINQQSIKDDDYNDLIHILRA